MNFFSNKIVMITAVLAVIIFIGIIIYKLDFSKDKISWGVTFSADYVANDLNLDWRQVYTNILDDLKVDHIRLSAYWSNIEPQIGQYNFSDLDWQINEASKRNVKIILAIGRRLPRWPECHDPVWLKDSAKENINSSQLSLIEKIISRYNQDENIIAWQVENEPFLGTFGICPKLDKNLFKTEIELVRKLSQKPIMVTDSGELGTWIPASKTGADIVGSTLYRVVYDKRWGYQRYPLPPAFYTLKAWIIKNFFNTKSFIIAELQAESWHPDGKNISQMSRTDNDKSMSLEQFKNNIAFAPKTGADAVYLWGVEWWYYMKEKNNDDRYWTEAKKLWQ